MSLLSSDAQPVNDEAMVLQLDIIAVTATRIEDEQARLPNKII